MPPPPPKDNKDYRWRAKLFVARKKVEDKTKETLILFMAGISATEESNFENDFEMPNFFNIMDVRLKYGRRAELTNKFE